MPFKGGVADVVAQEMKALNESCADARAKKALEDERERDSGL